MIVRTDKLVRQSILSLMKVSLQHLERAKERMRHTQTKNKIKPFGNRQNEVRGEVEEKNKDKKLPNWPKLKKSRMSPKDDDGRLDSARFNSMIHGKAQGSMTFRCSRGKIL